jgi:cytochrome c oxidase subunit 2
VLLSQTCGSCHTIAGTDADGTVGPNLTHVGSRETLGAGVVDNTPEHLAEWIRDAHTIKPGALMPPYRLPTDDLNALVAYLEGLR